MQTKKRVYQRELAFGQHEIWEQLPAEVREKVVKFCTQMMLEFQRRAAKGVDPGEPEGHP